MYWEAVTVVDDRFAEIKKKLKLIGYEGRITPDMLKMGEALLKYRKVYESSNSRNSALDI